MQLFVISTAVEFPLGSSGEQMLLGADTVHRVVFWTTRDKTSAKNQIYPMFNNFLKLYLSFVFAPFPKELKNLTSYVNSEVSHLALI
jgi:hypothetical protein